MQVKVRAGKPYVGYMSNTYNDFDIFKGEIIPNPKWVHSDSICLSTDDPFVAMRVIKKSDIISMDEKTYVSDYAKQSTMKTIAITGSKGDIYNVTQHDGHWSCDCKGFQYRRNCNHVGLAKLQ